MLGNRMLSTECLNTCSQNTIHNVTLLLHVCDMYCDINLRTQIWSAALNILLAAHPSDSQVLTVVQ